MTHVLKKFAVIILIAVLGPLGALNALAASSLSDIKVSNAQREATVSVSFNGPPDYAFSRCTARIAWFWTLTRRARSAACRSISAAKHGEKHSLQRAERRSERAHGV